MSIPIWTEVVCRTCATAHNGEFTYSKLRRRSLVDAAKANGWIFKEDECFCSAGCLDRYIRVEKKQLAAQEGEST